MSLLLNVLKRIDYEMKILTTRLRVATFWSVPQPIRLLALLSIIMVRI